MALENVEIYGNGDLEAIPGLGPNGLVRVPAAIRHQLNKTARHIAMDSIGIEVQFVTKAPIFDIHMSVLKPEHKPRGMVRVYKGDFLCEEIEIEPGIALFHRISVPIEFYEVKDKLLNRGAYSPSVWRIVCDRGVYVIHGINTHGYPIRRPRQSELPALKWLAYGSSITNSDLDGYPHIAASILGLQVQNMGFSGSCHIEKAIVDYMLDGCTYDLISCELGVNMRYDYSAEEFENRASYLIDRLAQMQKPALILTTFPNCCSQAYAKTSNTITRRERQFNQVLEGLVDQVESPHIVLLQGYEVLSDLRGLSGDLLHPTKYGHAVMGINLADQLKNLIHVHGLSNIC